MDTGRYRWVEVGWTAFKLGMTSFGGPVAHIGFFRQQYVERKKWLTDEAFSELTALCQFLPGPASSQLGMAIGIQRAGFLGGISAWIGFTFPSAILMVLLGMGIQDGALAESGWLHGLKLAAVAVIVQAVWSMARTLTPDRPRIAMAALTAAFVLLVPGTVGQITPIVLCGIVGGIWLQPAIGSPVQASPAGGRSLSGTLYLAIFALLLIVVPLLSTYIASPLLQLANIGYRTGSLVFGGGHVVLPMLQEGILSSGLVTEQQFMAGYGAAQAVPGPLFTFAAYLGAVSAPGVEGLIRAVTMLVSVFLPSFLLVAGVMPFWNKLRTRPGIRGIVTGVNASVVGILLAALYDPVWTSTVKMSLDFVIVLFGILLIMLWRCPAWLLVILAAFVGWIISI